MVIQLTYIGALFEDIGKRTGPDTVITEINLIDGCARIIVPSLLRDRLTEWYHETLLHPGVNRMYNTMHQHFTWPKMKTSPVPGKPSSTSRLSSFIL
jgi:Integrase zinc binding domain